VRAGGLAAIVDLAMARYFSEDFRARRPEVVRSVAERFLRTPAAGYIACCAAIARLDYSGRLGEIRAPTLVIAGGADVGTPVAMSEAIAKGIPGARLAVLPGAAHLSAVEDPEGFNALVTGFLPSASRR
jgi:3-oxoadipate enol-lactonase